MTSDDNQPEKIIAPAVAVSPEDQSSDRGQSDADNVIAVENQGIAQAERQAFSDVHNEKLDELIEASHEVARVNAELALATVEYQERARLARRRFRVTMIALGAVLVLLIAGVFALLISAAISRNQLADCIQPTGRCYQQSQKRTGQVLVDVQKIIVLAASCAPNYVNMPLAQRTAAIEACIEEGLK